VSQSLNGSADPRSQIRREMGFWDVLFLQHRYCPGPLVAAAAHNGTSSIRPVDTRCALFFCTEAAGHHELSSRFPEEGGCTSVQGSLWRFSRLRCGLDLLGVHDFLFSWLLLASTSMSAYVIGGKGAELAQDRTYLLVVNGAALYRGDVEHHRPERRQVLQNAGGVSTYLPRSSCPIGGVIWLRRGSVTHFTLSNMMPR